MARALFWRVRAARWQLHDLVRDRAWIDGHYLRKWRHPRSSGTDGRTVLHVTGSFDVGGTQTQIKHLCTAPSARFTHRATEIFPELNYLYRQDVAIDADRYRRGGVGRALGAMVIDINRRSSQLVQVYKLVRDFRAERAGIVVGWGHEMAVTTFLAAAIARVPHIIFCIRTVNPTYGWVEAPIPALLLRAHRRMLPFASKVIVNSALLRDDYSEWAGADPRTIAVCANGIDHAPLAPPDAAAARARVRASHGIAPDIIVITNVGRFSKEKGQASIVDANRLLLARQAGPRFVWLLYGDGPTLPAVQAAAAAHGMTNVIFAGRTKVVPDVLAASDIFVMPSDFEGMPNAMMEAMAAGLPCVSTTRSGARDIARDGAEALYYEPGRADQLADRMAFLFDNPDKARAMAAAGEARIKTFDVPRMVATFESILDAVASTRGRP